MKPKLPSPSLVISIIALVVATAGTATAAGVLIKSSSQVKANAIRATDIRNELTGADLRNGSISGNDLKDGTISAKHLRDGAIDEDKLKPSLRSTLRERSTGGTATEVVRKAGPEDQAPGAHRVVTLPQLPPGTYLLMAKTTISPISSNDGLLDVLLRDAKTASAECILEANGDRDHSRTPVASPATFTPATLNNQLTRTIDRPTDVTYDCNVNDLRWRASDTSVVALRLESSTRTDATG